MLDVGESVRQPLKYWRINVQKGVGLLAAMVEAGVRKIIFSSTCATYGVPVRVPIDETHPQEPINPYGASKLMVEQMLRDASAAHNLNYAILRYFNVAGADPRMRRTASTWAGRS